MLLGTGLPVPAEVWPLQRGSTPMLPFRGLWWHTVSRVAVLVCVFTVVKAV